MKIFLNSISLEIHFEELNGAKNGYIEVADLKAFKALIKKYGQCIVDQSDLDADFVVCVYDDYAE